MKKITSITSFIALAIAATVTIVACNGDKAKGTETTTTESKESLVERGGYLVASMACDDCHSPKKYGPKGPEIDPDLRLSGRPAAMPTGKIDTTVLKDGWALMDFTKTSTVGPWGISFSANITSDSTGIGLWSEEQFFTAMRKGLYKGLEGSRPLLPPMPWQSYKNLKDEDLRAIFAYLKSTKPIRNIVPETRPLSALK